MKGLSLKKKSFNFGKHQSLIGVALIRSSREIIKLFLSLLNSTEHEISIAHICKMAKINIVLALNLPVVVFILLIHI